MDSVLKPRLGDKCCTKWPHTASSSAAFAPLVSASHLQLVNIQAWRRQRRKGKQVTKLLPWQKLLSPCVPTCTAQAEALPSPGDRVGAELKSSCYVQPAAPAAWRTSRKTHVPVYCSSSPTPLLWYLSLSKMASPFHARLASREPRVSGELRLSPSSLSNSYSSISMPITFFSLRDIIFMDCPFVYGPSSFLWPTALPPPPPPPAYFLLPS